MGRVLIFIAYYPPSMGGAERNTYELSKRLVRKGYKVDVITCNATNVPNIGKLPTYERLDGISIYRLPSWNILGGEYPIPKPSFTTFKILFKLLRNDYGIINTHQRIYLTSFLGLMFARIKRVPLVHTERGTKPAATRGFTELVRIINDQTLGRLVISSAWKTVGVSLDTCKFLKKLGAKEPVLIHNGININIFERKEAKKPDNTITMTFVGRLVYGKGIQDLISVFPEIASEYEVKLLIIGDGAYKPELEELAQNKGNIHFLGQKEQGEVIEILNSSDIFVNPSYSEGLPTSVLEAGAAELAIVATDVGGTKEIIEDGKTGFLVPPTDTEALKEEICQLIENKKLREDFGRNIHKFVKKNFNWDEIIEKWIEEIGSKLGEEARSGEKDINTAAIEYFDSVAKTSHGEYDASSGKGLKAKLVEYDIVLGMLSDIDFAGKRILDAGCGHGRTITRLVPQNANIVGVDASVGMLKICHDKFKNEQVELIWADIERVPFKKHSFDIVLCLNTLVYFTEKSRAIILSNLVDLVAPGGRIITDVKNSWCPYYHFKRSDIFAQYYSIHSITRALKNAGCNNIRKKGVYPFSTPISPSIIAPIVVISADIPTHGIR